MKKNIHIAWMDAHYESSKNQSTEIFVAYDQQTCDIIAATLPLILPA